MATSIGPTYDPTSTAAALAEKYTSARQQIITTQNGQASAAAKALNTLNAAITGFQSSLASLTGLKSMLSQSASFSDTTIGSASASATASAGSYAFFVEELATAHQVSWSGLPVDTAVAGAGSFTLKAGATPFTVNLEAADADGDTKLSVREIAAAINSAAGNAGQVSASVVTIDGTAQLIMTAKNTGLDHRISVDGTKLADGPLKTMLGAAPAQVVEARNAVVWLGAQTSGTRIEQASNTFSNIDGVSMTFTRAQATGDSPVRLTVAGDNARTITNVQAFIDSYNKLKTVIDGLVAAGDPSSGAARGAFAADSGVKVLQSRLISMLRQTGSSSLATFGITASRDGTLTLKAERLTSQLALDPTGLDALIGRAGSSGASGIAGNLDTYLKEWSSSTDGQIKQRKEANERLQTQLTKRQDVLDTQYDRAYNRYLLQFTQLQALQSRMASNTSLFDALFSDKSN